MIVSMTHILPLTTVRRARMLSERGRVLVRVGQKVNASDVIAECYPNRQHVLLDVRRAFNLSRAEEAERLVVQKVGDPIQKNDILAEKRGLFSRLVRAPFDGSVAAISNGQILLETLGPAENLQAGISGVVAEVMPERGAIIENSGVLVQGVWGNGRIDQGLLTVLSESPDEEFTRAGLNMTMRGSVLVAGYCLRADALKAVVELSLRGLILSSLNPDLMELACQLHFPVIVLEGFGKIPMDQVAYQLLSTNIKRDVCLNAAIWNQSTGLRSELFIPLPATGQVASETVQFAPGKTVRLLTTPYQGMVGTVQSIPEDTVRLPSGLRAQVAVIKLSTNQQVTAPLTNLDVLE